MGRRGKDVYIPTRPPLIYSTLQWVPFLSIVPTDLPWRPASEAESTNFQHPASFLSMIGSTNRRHLGATVVGTNGTAKTRTRRW